MGKLIVLKRNDINLERTFGQLLRPDGTFWCDTLEDPVRNVKIPGKTAIPAGTYQVIVAWSNRFKRLMPRLLDVPFYTGILIHSGETVEHTEGCPLVGLRSGEKTLVQSKAIFPAIFDSIVEMTSKGKLFLKVEGGFNPQDWIVQPPKK